MRTVICIPTYNEIDNIDQIIDLVLHHVPTTHILVIDDGSPDGTAIAVRRRMSIDKRIHIIERQQKLGLGTAYCAGFAWAIQRGYDVVMQMDADLSHDAKDVPRLLAAVETADVVIGSRYVSGVNVINWPMSRLLLSYFANVYTRFITGMPIRDATGGFKCLRTEVLRAIDLSQIRSNGYAFQIEMTFRLWCKGARVMEIPIVFVDRISGTSKMSKNIIFEAAWLVWKLKLTSLFRCNPLQ
jgi:dolichol-phosphate mannosyltransferase